jgi:hypothetical protein
MADSASLSSSSTSPTSGTPLTLALLPTGLPFVDELRRPFKSLRRDGSVFALEFCEPFVQLGKMAEPSQVGGHGTIYGCRKTTGTDQLAKRIKLPAFECQGHLFARHRRIVVRLYYKD